MWGDKTKRNEEQQMEACKEVIYLYENYTGWWFQPIWKILYSQNGNLPQIGVKIKMFETTS